MEQTSSDAEGLLWKRNLSVRGSFFLFLIGLGDGDANLGAAFGGLAKLTLFFRQIRALHQPVHLPDQIHHILVLPAAYRHISSVSAAAAACFVKIGFSAISVLFYSFYFFLTKKKISF